jgi:hypothetical protein
MKTLHNLPRLWSALTRSSGVITPAITTHQIDFWMSLHPDFGGFCFAVSQEVNDLVALQIYQDRAEFSPTTERSGKGNDVTAIPSPKNRTGRFLYIRLKPFSPPVSPDGVSQRVNPGCELVGGTWDGAELGFLHHLIPLLIAILHDGCAIR